MSAVASYVKKVWDIRYFWTHLVLADIRNKYRRSFLGLAWATIQPLSLALLFSFVMGSFFKVPMRNYAPYIFSGVVLWEYITSSIVTGCNAFINAEGYIKQFSHPLVIYSLRQVLTSTINLLCAFVGLIIWVLYLEPSNFGITWISLFASLVVVFIFVWSLATCTAFINVKFRDFSQLTVILLQAIYYVSPVLFMPKLFISSNLGWLLEINPLYHLLNLFRRPLLEGKFPHLYDYAIVLFVSVIFWILGSYFIKLNEKKVIFYI